MALPQPSPEAFTEDKIRNSLYESLVAGNPNDVIVEKWSSHSVKLSGKKERQFMLNEIDIGRFSLTPVPPSDWTMLFSGLKNRITFTAYEIKGNTKSRRGKGEEPSLAEGIGQAVINLYQGADFSVLVRPDPGIEKRGHLIKMCEAYAPRVDLWLYDGQIFVAWKMSQPSTFNASNEQEKRTLLTRLVSSGGRTRIHLPEWAKQGKY